MTSSAATTTFDIAPGPNERQTRQRLEEWFPQLVREPGLHARFVNTLSMLEHIGSVKIARTRSGMGITTDVLEHLAEETRHAFYLKRLAKKIDAEVDESYGESWLLEGAAARGYFARLDVAARRFAREHLSADEQADAPYLLVSWLVERRAMWLYPAYQEALLDLGRGYSVRTIVNDEADHLAEMVAGLEERNLTRHPALPDLVAEEESLFAKFSRKMMAQE